MTCFQNAVRSESMRFVERQLEDSKRREGELTRALDKLNIDVGNLQVCCIFSTEQHLKLLLLKIKVNEC